MLNNQLIGILNILIPFANCGYLNLLQSTRYFDTFQGKLVPKLTLGPFLTLRVRIGPNLQSYLFQKYISLNPRRVELNNTIYYKKMAETIN